MSGTTEQTSVPVTNGYSPFVPTPGVEIQRITPAGSGTTDRPAMSERIYPPPNAREQP